MSFLDENGLSYFYRKLKEIFVRSVTAGSDILTPDESGNVTITNVATANNLTSPDAQTSYDTFIYRTSGGSASLTSGDAQLMYVDGNINIVGRVVENFDITATNGITVSYDAAVWKNTIDTSGTYYFRYTCPSSSVATQSWSSAGTWTSDGVGEVVLASYGLNATNIINPNINIVFNSGIVNPSISADKYSSSITEVTVNMSTFANQMHASGSYQFTYSATGNSWQYLSENVLLNTYGISIVGTPQDNDTIVVTYEAGNSGLSEATIIPSTFANQMHASGSYQFTYSVAENSWQYLSENVLLNTYGISIVGTPNNGDTITVNFVVGTPDSVVTVVYTAAEQGTIHVATPTGFSATGFNQFDKDTMFIENATFTNGAIASGANYVAYCRAKGGVDNGYVAYSEGEYILGIGWCATLPAIGTVVTTTDAAVSSSLASIPFANDGYVVIEVTNMDDLCVHPKWSGSADTDYAAYVAPSTITFPLEDVEGMDLPLKTYGMPRIGAVVDTLDLDAGTYVQRIGRLAYTPANMNTVISYGTAYDYDNNWIYYVLPQQVTYSVNVSPDYIVNDWGTEEFLGTTVPVSMQTLYSQNLRDKLRTDVLTVSQQNPGLTASQLSTIAKSIGLAFYPVGSIYISINSINPSNLFGGTWEQIKDTFLLSAGDTYVAGDEGGSATKNLQHTHTTGNFTLTRAHIPNYEIGYIPDNVPGNHGTWNNGGIKGTGKAKASNQNLPMEGTKTASGSYSYGWTISSYGGGGSHNHGATGNGLSTGQDIMPPYLAVYMWKRIA